MRSLKFIFIFCIVLSLLVPTVMAIDYKDLSQDEITALSQLRTRNIGTANEWSETKFQSVIDSYFHSRENPEFKKLSTEGFPTPSGEKIYGASATQMAALSYASEELVPGEKTISHIERISGEDIATGTTIAELKRNGLLDDQMRSEILYESEIDNFYNLAYQEQLVERALDNDLDYAQELSRHDFDHQISTSNEAYRYTAGHRMVFEAAIDVAVASGDKEALEKLYSGLDRSPLIERTSDPQYERRILRARIRQAYQQVEASVEAGSGFSIDASGLSEDGSTVSTPIPLATSNRIDEGIYTVQRGDTLGEIAGRSGIPIQFLVGENGEVTDRRGNERELNPNIIQIGDKIVIPPKEIAEKYDKRDFNHPFGCEE